MGMGTIMQAKRILLLCSGKQKAEILYQALYGNIDPKVPASILQLHRDLTVVADKEALSIIDANIPNYASKEAVG
jgi:glucosamine-6-phosphate deaminase